jgi:hypothetical protein
MASLRGYVERANIIAQSSNIGKEREKQELIAP